MKKKGLIFSGIAVVVAAILGITCYSMFSSVDETKEKYVSLIPNDVDLVLRVDVASIFEKSEIKDSKLMKEFENAASSNIESQYLKDPKKMGLDVRYPLYAFGSFDTQSFGVVGKVLDESDFRKFLEDNLKFAKFGSKDGKTGITFVKNEDSDDGLIAFDSESVIFLAGNHFNEEYVCGLFQNEKKFTDTEDFKKFYSEKKDMNLFLSLKNFDKLPVNVENLDYFNYKGYNVLLSLAFEKSEAVFKCSTYGSDEKTQKEIDRAAGLLVKTTGKYLNLFNDNCAFFAHFGMNERLVSEWFSRIMQIEEFQRQIGDEESKKILDQCEMILKQINGDVAFSMDLDGGSMDRYGSPDMSFNLLADVKSNKIVDDIKNLCVSAGAPLEEENGMYMIPIGGKACYMGVKGETFFVSTNVDKAFSSKKKQDIKVSGNIESNYVFYILDPKPFKPFYGMLGEDKAEILNKFANVHYLAEKPNEVICKIVTTDDQNILKTIVDLLEKFM